MKKHNTIPLLAVLGGTVAFVLRLLQNRTGFESGTGLPIPGNPAGVALAICLVVLAAALFLLTWKLPGKNETAPAFPQDFSTEEPKQLMLPVTGALLIALSGLADLYEALGFGKLLAQIQAAADPYSPIVTEISGFAPRAQLLLAVLSLLSAAALLAAAAACRRKEDIPNKISGCTFLLMPPVALVVRLVLTYRLDSVNPALAAYYVELLALVFLTLGFYRLSSFAFEAGQTSRFTLYSGMAVVLCLAALADGGPHFSSLLLYTGGALTLLGFLLRTPFHENE